MKHEGFSKARLHPNSGNDREVAYAKAWVEENKISDTLKHLIPECTDRDAQVAATIIQWLGSNVGNHFLGKVIAENENISASLQDVISHLTHHAE